MAGWERSMRAPRAAWSTRISSWPISRFSTITFLPGNGGYLTELSYVGRRRSFFSPSSRSGTEVEGKLRRAPGWFVACRAGAPAAVPQAATPHETAAGQSPAGSESSILPLCPRLHRQRPCLRTCHPWRQLNPSPYRGRCRRQLRWTKYLRSRTLIPIPHITGGRFGRHE